MQIRKNIFRYHCNLEAYLTYRLLLPIANQSSSIDGKMTKIEIMIMLACTKGGKPHLFIIDIESIASIPAVHLCPVSKGDGFLKKSVKACGSAF